MQGAGRLVGTLAACAAFGAGAGLAPAAVAAEGDLDPSFSGDGIATDGFETGGGAEGISTVMLGDGGSITVVGIARGNGYGLVRYGPDGTPDPAFGDGGSSFFAPPDASFTSVSRATSGPGGHIVVGGYGIPPGGDGDATVAAFGPNGRPDATFGNDPPNPVGDGYVRTALPGPDPFDVGLDVAVDAEGRTVLVGRTEDSAPHAFLIRYLADGSIDPSLGIKTYALGGSDLFADVEILSDGRLLVLGKVDDKWVLIRLTAAGELDPTYGAGGIAALGLVSPQTEAGKLALQPDGKAVVAATIGTSPDFSARLLRVDANGVLDSAFASGGAAELPAPTSRLAAGGVAIADDGKIVVAGATRDERTLVWRYLPSGQLDPAFGSGGLVTAAGPGGFASVAIQPDRRIILGGFVDIDPTTGIDHQFLTARLIGDATPPDTVITKAKRKRRVGQKAKVRFKAEGDVNTAFECALNQPKKKRGANVGNSRPARFSSCASPERTKKLKRPGKHRFLVRAIDPAGNVDATPAKTRLKVKPKPKRR